MPGVARFADGALLHTARPHEMHAPLAKVARTGALCEPFPKCVAVLAKHIRFARPRPRIEPGASDDLLRIARQWEVRHANGDGPEETNAGPEHVFQGAPRSRRRIIATTIHQAHGSLL